MSEIKLTADSGGGTTSLKAPSTTTSNADVVLKLPVADGSSGEVLKTNGSGQLSFGSNAGTIINNNADNRVITGSGTASTLNGEANCTFNGDSLGLNSSSTTEVNLQYSNNTRLKIHAGSNFAQLLTQNDVPLSFKTDAGTGSGTSRLVINTNGNVGIGTTSPVAKLQLNTSHYVVTSSGRSTTGIHLNGLHGNAGEYGGGISFACGGEGSVAIAARQATSSQHRVGMSFFTHDTTTHTDNAVEKVRIHDSGETSFNDGICLGNGLTLSSANTLDDYEEGTFTPSFNMTGGGHNITYTVQQGNYTKIGNMVGIEIYLNIDTIHANGSGVLRIGGLPFTKTGRYGGLNISYIYGLNNVEIVHALVDTNTNQIFLYTLSQASSNYHSANTSVATALTNAGEIMLNGIYFAT